MAAGSEVALAGGRAVAVDEVDPERSIVALTGLDARPRRGRARAVRRGCPRSGVFARGTIVVDARATGTARAPLATGTARLDDVELRPRAAAWPVLRVNGVVESNGHTVSTRALRIETTGPAEGALTVGAPDAPASVDLTTAWPPRVSHVDVPLSARGLRVGGARSPFAIGAPDLRLRLAGDPARELVLSGDVGVARAHVDPFAGKRRQVRPGATLVFEGLLPHLTLDLTLHGPDDAVVVDVLVLPDIDFGFRCQRRRQRARRHDLRPGARRVGLLAPHARALRTEGHARVPRPQGMMISVWHPTRTSTRPAASPRSCAQLVSQIEMSVGEPFAGSTS